MEPFIPIAFIYIIPAVILFCLRDGLEGNGIKYPILSAIFIGILSVYNNVIVMAARELTSFIKVEILDRVAGIGLPKGKNKIPMIVGRGYREATRCPTCEQAIIPSDNVVLTRQIDGLSPGDKDISSIIFNNGE